MSNRDAQEVVDPVPQDGPAAYGQDEKMRSPSGDLRYSDVSGFGADFLNIGPATVASCLTGLESSFFVLALSYTGSIAREDV
jgi:hypothetical protein